MEDATMLTAHISIVSMSAYRLVVVDHQAKLPPGEIDRIAAVLTHTVVDDTRRRHPDIKSLRVECILEASEAGYHALKFVPSEDDAVCDETLYALRIAIANHLPGIGVTLSPDLERLP